MDRKERHIRENEGADRNNGREDLIAESLTAAGRDRKRNNTRRTNRLWIWLGVLVLIIILLWWLFSIGMFEDMTGVINGN